MTDESDLHLAGFTPTQRAILLDMLQRIEWLEHQVKILSTINDVARKHRDNMDIGRIQT